MTIPSIHTMYDYEWSAYRAGVPVDPFTLNVIVVVCYPYLGVLVELLFRYTSNLTLICWASWSFISTMHSSIFMCSLERDAGSKKEDWTLLANKFPTHFWDFQVSWESGKNRPGREKMNNWLKLLLLAELGSLPGQLCADVQRLGVKLGICF